jgi:hypothetical protein
MSDVGSMSIYWPNFMSGLVYYNRLITNKLACMPNFY